MEPKIKAGTIWTNSIDTCEWLVDMHSHMPLISATVLFNGEHPEADSNIPDWIKEKLKIL